MAFMYSLFALAAASQTFAQHGGPPSGFGGRPGASAPTDSWSGAGQSAGSPAYTDLFSQPLPLPSTPSPDHSVTVDGRTIDFYTLEVKPFQLQVYPDLGPANLIGYNGVAPGPGFKIQQGRETIIRVLNHGDNDTVMHLHGSYTHAAWDGFASDLIPIDSFKDYYYPNSESARSIWYHGHADTHTSIDAYYGQAGIYQIYDPSEDSLGLPSGDYDIPLAITDKIYQSNGDLQSPAGDVINFFGDIIHVNEIPWPYFEVEPRKYRLRLYDISLSRTYDLYFEDPDSNLIPFQVIATDSGLVNSPVTTSDVTIAMGERYEVVIDFSAYKGKNITLKNGMQQEQIQEYDNTDKVMMFVVGDDVSDDSNNGDVPGTLNANINWPESKTSVDQSFNFQMGGDNVWTINGISFNDVNNRILARPPQGTTELWEVHHTGGPAVHPVHIHLVNMQILSRTGGSRGLLPYESAGLKDIVLLEPGETARILAYYGPWNGVYMFHCHNLIHEDHAMMDAFNVTLMESLGYGGNMTANYGDPMDPRFTAQPYSDQAYSPAAISSAVSSLGSMNPYGSATASAAAYASYIPTMAADATPTKTVEPISSGYGFASTTFSGTTTAFVTTTAVEIETASASAARRHVRDFA